MDRVLSAKRKASDYLKAVFAERALRNIIKTQSRGDSKMQPQEMETQIETLHSFITSQLVANGLGSSELPYANNIQRFIDSIKNDPKASCFEKLNAIKAGLPRVFRQEFNQALNVDRVSDYGPVIGNPRFPKRRRL